MSTFLDRKLSSLTPYTPGEQPKTTGEIIKLNTNESPYPPSPKVISALADEAEISNLRLYPDPTCRSLTCSIADRFGILPENVTVGNGSDELLAFCFHAFCENGAVFPDITYGFYEVFCKMFGTPFSTIPLKEDFTVDVDAFCKSKATVFIANPNAPTGLSLSPAEIEKIVSSDTNRLVIIDEAYVDFGAESVIPLTSKYENLLVIHTMSKSRSLAGGRIGYAIADRALIADLELMRFSFNPYNINRLSLIAGAASVSDEKYFDECRKKIIASRKVLIREFSALGFSVTDSCANFIFAGKHPKITAEQLMNKLRDRNIIVRHFNKPRLSDFLRITVGSEAQCKKLIEAVKSILCEV